MTVCDNCEGEVRRRLHCACGFKVCTGCVVSCAMGYCVSCKLCDKGLVVTFGSGAKAERELEPKRSAAEERRKVREAKKKRRRLVPEITVERRRELTRELAKVNDEIDQAYWIFTRTARGKPPAITHSHLYRRRVEIEHVLTTGREQPKT